MNKGCGKEIEDTVDGSECGAYCYVCEEIHYCDKCAKKFNKEGEDEN